MLYTKTKGVLLAKGKYVLLLDEDDIYAQRDAFSTLYRESEKYNLDMLGFKLIQTTRKIQTFSFNENKKQFPIIYQPEISEIMYKINSSGQVKLLEGLLVTYFIKKNLFVKIIKQINKKYFENIMNFHDDFLLFFLLTRNSFNFKRIERIFYIIITDWNILDKNIAYRTNIKNESYKFNRCNSVLNYIEFILEKTENSFKDKKIAVYSIDKYLLNYFCRNFTKTQEKAINVSKLYIMNKYIPEDTKKRIRIFLKEKSIN